jgi:hypothetical protein
MGNAARKKEKEEKDEKKDEEKDEEKKEQLTRGLLLSSPPLSPSRYDHDDEKERILENILSIVSGG